MGPVPGLEGSPGGRKGNPLPHSCLKNSHGQRSLAGYSPPGRKDSDATEQLSTDIWRTPGAVSQIRQTRPKVCDLRLVAVSLCTLVTWSDDTTSRGDSRAYTQQVVRRCLLNGSSLYPSFPTCPYQLIPPHPSPCGKKFFCLWVEELGAGTSVLVAPFLLWAPEGSGHPHSASP